MFSLDDSSSLHGFTNTFVLSSTPGSTKILTEVPRSLIVDPSRQRRLHHKSGRGCDNCRKRRVRCDEGLPCSNCSRRQECCEYRQRVNRLSSKNSIPPQIQNSLPTIGPADAVVNITHLKLFHHFQTCTQQTLLFPTRFWENSLQLCFQYEYLINAMLCLAARHLAFLQPDDKTYPMVAVRHLSRCLSLFQRELSNNFASIHIDAFIATSVLLQYEVWTNIDCCSSRKDGSISFEPSKDRIFSLSSGLKQVFLKNLPNESGHPSILLEHAADDPRATLLEAAQISNETRAQYQARFSRNTPLGLGNISAILPYERNAEQLVFCENINVMRCKAGSENLDVGYPYIVNELCLLMSFLPESQPPTYVLSDKSLRAALIKYVFAFPVMCRGAFASLVEQKDPHAVLVLYHFYRTIRALPLESCWWSQRRAEMSEVTLKKWLVSSIETLTASKLNQSEPYC